MKSRRSILLIVSKVIPLILQTDFSVRFWRLKWYLDKYQHSRFCLWAMLPAQDFDKYHIDCNQLIIFIMVMINISVRYHLIRPNPSSGIWINITSIAMYIDLIFIKIHKRPKCLKISENLVVTAIRWHVTQSGSYRSLMMSYGTDGPLNRHRQFKHTSRWWWYFSLSIGSSSDHSWSMECRLSHVTCQCQTDKFRLTLCVGTLPSVA